jgi:hypothetical protein
MNSYIILEDSITLVLNMKQRNIDCSHPNFDEIVEAVRCEDWKAVEKLVDVVKTIKTFVGDDSGLNVDVNAGVITYNGREIHSTLTNRIFTMIEEGFNATPLINFLRNLMENPSKRAVDELYGFLEYGKMPITPDGCFLAYKRVRDDYKSVHDGKTDNSIGNVVEMPRNAVDEDSQQTCSYGLHFCSHEYLGYFSGDRVVVLKVNPRDVVAIPVDYNNTKGRACRYEVVGELSPEDVQKALGQNVWDTSVVSDYEDDDRFEDEDFDDYWSSLDRPSSEGSYYDDDDDDDDYGW